MGGVRRLVVEGRDAAKLLEVASVGRDGVGVLVDDHLHVRTVAVDRLRDLREVVNGGIAGEAGAFGGGLASLGRLHGGGLPSRRERSNLLMVHAVEVAASSSLVGRELLLGCPQRLLEHRP